MQQNPCTRSNRFVSAPALSSVLVAAGAIDLAADFAAGPSGAVNVYKSGASTNRGDQFIKFAGADSTFIREVNNIHRRDGA